MLSIRNRTVISVQSKFEVHDNLCQPEHHEDAGPLGSTEDGLVLTQQVCLVLTQRSKSFFIQKSHQHLHSVPTSIRSGMIDCVGLWLERYSNTITIRAQSFSV